MPKSTPLILGVLGTLAGLAGCSGNATSTDPSEGWRDTFNVSSATLAASGESIYANLRPGSVWQYAGGGDHLTITVLNETAVIDGVTTRIVEEREEAGGALKEVSRNFFALDPATGDLYYFGEEVDVHDNGTVNHPGAWRSGQSGARFGLLVPGKASVGDRFYQEVAPGVAMDRAEVVSIDERVRTPAGVFEHCLHIRETTPLEKGSSDKWFAPGVGLVRDDELELTSYKLAPK